MQGNLLTEVIMKLLVSYFSNIARQGMVSGQYFNCVNGSISITFALTSFAMDVTIMYVCMLNIQLLFHCWLLVGYSIVCTQVLCMTTSMSSISCVHTCIYVSEMRNLSC